MSTTYRVVHSADVPLHKVSAMPAEDSAGIPRRIPRTLSRLEIFQAIQNDLLRRGIVGREGLRLSDLKIQSSVPVGDDDAGLEVKHIGFDSIRRQTVFELWTSHEPQYLPFEVTTRRDPQSLGFSSSAEVPGEGGGGGSRGQGRMLEQGVSRPRSKAPVLAKPGRPATLVMLRQNARIITTVVPLQPGTMGQVILVRDPATARVMSAEVVDEGLLRTSF
jgi:hypothetical protein